MSFFASTLDQKIAQSLIIDKALAENGNVTHLFGLCSSRTIDIGLSGVATAIDATRQCHMEMAAASAADGGENEACSNVT